MSQTVLWFAKISDFSMNSNIKFFLLFLFYFKLVLKWNILHLVFLSFGKGSQGGILSSGLYRCRRDGESTKSSTGETGNKAGWGETAGQRADTRPGPRCWLTVSPNPPPAEQTRKPARSPIQPEISRTSGSLKGEKTCKRFVKVDLLKGGSWPLL